MRVKKIVMGILAAGVLLLAGYNIYVLVEKNVASNKIKEKVVYEEKRAETANEYLKIKAIEAIEDYYNVKIDGDKLEFDIEYNTMEKQLEDIGRYEASLKESVKELDEDMADYLEREKERITFGTIDFWAGEYSPEKKVIYSVSFDDETKELLEVSCIKRDVLRKMKSAGFIGVDESKKIAEEFIDKNNIEDIGQLKFIGLKEEVTYYGQEESIFDTFMLFYENVNDVNKKVNIKIDRVLGKVNSFSVGKKAVSECEKAVYNRSLVEAKEVESSRITREEAVKITENAFKEYFNIKVDKQDIAEDIQYNYSFAVWVGMWGGEKYSIALTKEGEILGAGYDEEIKQASLTKEEGIKIAIEFIKKHEFAEDEKDIKFVDMDSSGEYYFIYGKGEKTGKDKTISISLNGNHVDGFDLGFEPVE